MKRYAGFRFQIATIVCLCAMAAQSGDIVNSFEGAPSDTPYTAQALAGTNAATEAGPTGNYLRVTDAVNNQHVFVTFNNAQTGTASTITADFDFRIANGSEPKPADGFGFAILDCAQHNTTGAVTWGAAEAPSLARALGFGINVYNGNGSNGTCALYWNGAQVGATVDLVATHGYTPRKSGVNLATQTFDHCKIELDLETAQVTVTITPAGGAAFQPFVNVGIPNLEPFVFRAGFGGRCGGLNIHTAIDNVNITSVTKPVVSAPTISPNSGFYDNSVNVTVTQTETGGSTYYTTDGSVPTATNGTLVPGASTTFTVDTNAQRVTMVRARTYKTGFLPVAAQSTLTGYNLPVSVTGDLPGLRCIYYETNGQLLPHDPITPLIQQRRAPNFSGNNPGSHASVTPRLRDTNFGYRFSGYINIATTGIYRFFTNSDDGSRLYLDNVLIVENNFSQGFTERFGDVALDAGKHAFRVEFSQGGGGFGIASRYSAAGSTTQVDYDESATGVFTTEEVVENPVISISGGGSSFTGTTNVTISVVPANATIYYTTDGTAPTADSYTGALVGSGSFPISETTTVRAFARVAGGFDSSLISTTFVRNSAPTDAPRVLSAKVVSATQVDLLFNAAMGASANTAANYSIAGGPAVTAAVLDGDTKTVHLTLGTALVPTQTYVLTASNVQSAAGTVVDVNYRTATFRMLPNGVYFERFDGIGGTAVADLTSNVKFTGNTPDIARVINKFEIPVNAADTYGARLRAYLIAPATGTFTFRIASDDNSELHISPTTNPANKTGVAGVPQWTNSREFTKFPEDNDALPFNDQYGTFPMTQGQLYYIEALVKEGGGGDNLAVEYSLPSAPTNFMDIPLDNLIAFASVPVTIPGGGVLRERYDGIAGTAVVNLTSSVKYPLQPDAVDVVPTFESPQAPAQGDNYGMRLSGIYTHPGTGTGNFNFYIAGDDDCELFFSTDENPANAVRICSKVGGPYGNLEWQTGNGAKSANISLTGGNRYFIYALLKEGGGGDGVAVTVLPTGTDPVVNTTLPIDGANLTPAVIPIQILSQTQSKRVRYGQSTSIAVNAVGGYGTKAVQWLKNGTPIAGANGLTLNLTNVTGADTAQYTLQITGTVDGTGVNTVTSLPIPVQVFADIALDAPTLAQTYDSTPRIVTATTVPTGVPYTVTYNGQPQAINAGSYAIVAAGTTGIDATANGTLIVSPVTGATVTLAPQGGTLLYTGQTQTLATSTVPPNLNVNVTYNGGGSAVNAGSYNVVATINDPNAVGNPSDTETLVIDKAPLTVTALAGSRTYGDTSPVLPATPVHGTHFALSGFVNSETAAVVAGTPGLSTTAVAATTGPDSPGSPVGTYPITAALGSLNATNYSMVTFVDSTLTINKRPLDLQATSISLEYGEPTPPTLPFSVVPASLAPGDVAGDAILGGDPAIGTTRTLLSPVGTYPITLTIGTLQLTNNYQLGATQGGTLTVTPATNVSIIVPDTVRPYSPVPQPVTPTITPAGLNADITYDGSPVIPTNAGVYTVAATVNDPNALGNPQGTGTLTITKAVAGVAITNLFQAENGTPRTVTVITNPLNLAVDVTYNGSTTAPTLPGTYTVVATINETNYQGTVTETLRIGGPPPVITSPLTATPNPVQVGKPVVFSIAATHPLGMPVTISFDYGDGVSDSTGLHTYNFPQIATVTASVSDGLNTITSTISVLVFSAASPQGDIDGDGIPNGLDSDTDGDGVSDALEALWGSSPVDSGSSPLTDAASGVNPGPLDVKKMSIKLTFSRLLSDSIALSGTLPVKAGFKGSAQRVMVDVGGVVKIFTLDARNQAKSGNDSLKLTVKGKKGVVSADQNAKFMMKAGRATFFETLAAAGLANETVKNKTVNVRVDVIFNGQLLRKLVPQTYTAKQGSTGRTK